MTKKKVEETKKLTPAQYWEWKCYLEEMNKAKVNDKRVNLEQEIMNKEIENRKLKLALFKETVRSARRSVISSQEEFEKVKQRIEEELGMKLEDCTIDPYTLEVKKIGE